jgi:succinate dehydrogenase / fumarate reductase iron-sulfur subunit
MEVEKNRKIIFKIKRWDPEKGRFYISTYEVPTRRGMTVLEGLIYIKENIDHTLAYRRSCRMGVCGTCGVIINGKPMLSCSTQIYHLNTDVITIEPLKNLPLVKDLIVDHTPFFEKQSKIKPYIIRSDEAEYWEPTREYLQTPKELEEYLQFSYCLTCALCYSACPISGTSREYLGPQALMNAYRFIADNRDEGVLERLDIVDTPDGCWGCHLAGSCSDVCPKGVDPAFAIQLLRKKIVERDFGYLERKKGSRVAPPLPIAEKKTTKTPPPFTVEGAEIEA